MIYRDDTAGVERARCACNSDIFVAAAAATIVYAVDDRTVLSVNTFKRWSVIILFQRTFEYDA